MEEKRMRVAFLSGPYRAGNGRTVRYNIRAAEEALIRWMRKGFAVICPHKNSAFLDGELPDEVFLEADLEMIRRLIPGTDFLVLLKGWEHSAGSRSEIQLADALGIEVVSDEG